MSANQIINNILGWPRGYKRATQVFVDIFLISISFVSLLSLWSASLTNTQLLVLWAALVLSYPTMLALLKIYSSVVRFIQPSIVLRLGIVSFLSVFLIYGLDKQIGSQLPDRFFIDLGFLAVVASMLPRMLFVQLIRWRDKLNSRKVVIYGAGEAGRQLRSALDENSDYRVMAFIDDSRDLQGSVIHGLSVMSIDSIRGLMAKGLVEVLLAIPSASRQKRKEIINVLEPMGLHIRTVPKLDDIVSGRSKLAQLQDITSEDLLGRDPVPPAPALMARNIEGKTVLVTGAGGTIGAQICREAVVQRPGKLVIFEASELALYSIENELIDFKRESGLEFELVPILGSVCNAKLLKRILAREKVDSIFHAAAYKHVPMVELNPLQGIQNNAIGTWVLANAAKAAGVSAFVLVSTDKAVRPPNVMGASKRVAELCVQALAAEDVDNNCSYSIVRFGNVLGSSGSVIPRFREQIAAGGPVTVTDASMTRYFMTVAEAAQLVIQAGAMGKNGEVFVLDMGEAVNIYELALRKIRLHGLEPKTADNPDGDIEIEITGIRPGEKLYEELLIEGACATYHPRIYKADEPQLSLPEVTGLISRLESAVEQGAVEQMYMQLRNCSVLHYQDGTSANPEADSDDHRSSSKVSSLTEKLAANTAMLSGKD